MIRHNKRHDSARKRHDSAQQAAWFGTARGRVRLCLHPPPPCARRRRPLCHNGARENPIYIARANPILYIRVRRREGENVLHRVAGNDVDNFSVDNPLWITAAAGCRLLRGRRRRQCGGSVNAGTPFRPHDCDFTAWTGRTYIKYMRARDPLRQMCVKPADLTTHSSPSTPAPPRSAHARPLAARCIPVVLTTRSSPKAFARPRTATRPLRARPLPHAAPMHARRLRNAFLAEGLCPPPLSDTPAPFRSASGTKKRHRTVDVRCRMSRSTVVAVGHLGW